MERENDHFCLRQINLQPDIQVWCSNMQLGTSALNLRDWGSGHESSDNMGDISVVSIVGTATWASAQERPNRRRTLWN